MLTCVVSVANMDKGVMEDAITCTVCSEEYRTGKHDPLIMPCGHTFCRDCIISIKTTKNVSCPTCREQHEGMRVESLPLNYSILSLSENMTHKQPQTCKKHGKLLDLWCSQCRVVVCGLCVAMDHRQETHEILSAQEYLSIMKRTFQSHEDVLDQMISKRKSQLSYDTKHTLVNLLNIFKDHRELKSLTSEISEMSKEAYETGNIESMEIYQAKLNSLQCLVTNSMKHEIIQENTTAASTSDDDDNSENTTPNANTVNCYSQVLPMPGLPNQELPSPLSICIKDSANRCAILSWEDNRFLLSAFLDNTINSHVTIQWNIFATLLPTKIPEAFLELKVGDHLLGRVYIRLWGHLRRSHHFLALCLGSLGPSYTNGVFRSSHKDEFKERICGCTYKNLDGSISTKGLMENLEWDGEYAEKSTEGLVVGTSGGKSEMDALFSIYTKVTNKASCFCPFGEVVSGLDIVRQAAEYNPVTAVFVNRCGIVIPTSSIKPMH